MDVDLVKEASLFVLKGMPHKPFLCLPLSALLYAVLKDNHGLEPQLVTGDLTFKNDYIFKQDFSVVAEEQPKFKLWAGHAWVELDNHIIDLSFFRTLYSDQFTKSYKEELLEFWGKGRGILITPNREIKEAQMKYHPKDILADDLVTAIIKGMDALI